MSPYRLDGDDQRNTSFGPGSAPAADHRPGFLDDSTKQKDVRGEERFPRRSPESEVPRESLASRISQSRKGS
jgi:hypothetical protein